MESARTKESSWVLWYPRPAGEWVEALPVGNGHMGAMVFGGVSSERIQFNADTLWTGRPQDYQHPGASAQLPVLRRMLFEGAQDEAHELAMKEFMSDPLTQDSYQPFGDLVIEFPAHGEHAAYRRQLDLDAAVASVEYTVGDERFTRRVFASYPDGVIVVRLEADKPGSLSFAVSLATPHEGCESSEADFATLALTGGVTRRGGSGSESVLRFESRVHVAAEDGAVTIGGGRAEVREATAVTLILTAATSYVDFQDVSGDPSAACGKVIERASALTYGQLLERHQSDHRALFRRVDLDLGSSEAATDDTASRVARFKERDDPQLAALYFQYGRYLLIASSRAGSQPGNLQGVWNDELDPPWDSKWTVNINTEMNYWPTEATNLSECHDPLFDMLADVAVAGAATAKTFYDCRGWVLHHNTDIWRGTAAINHANHGIWPVGGAWLCQHLWWRYEYTRDVEFLRSRAYPVLKPAAEFFLDYLVEDPRREGVLISGPSNSPEQGGLVMGPTMDHQIIRNLFRITAEAARALEVDEDFARELESTGERIAPNHIGRHGQLQEWLEDVDDPANEHRHTSHLWGLHPGREITRRGTPELWNAARTSLEHRGDGGTGWSMGWKINFWSRFEDGDHAHLMLANQLTPERTYPNLFDAHPPFQIDGNFGACAGIAEMLLQSHERAEDGVYVLHLLPALPSAWAEGRVSGLRARGGFEVELAWSGGKLATVRLTGSADDACVIRYGDRERRASVVPGESVVFDGTLAAAAE